MNKLKTEFYRDKLQLYKCGYCYFQHWQYPEDEQLSAVIYCPKCNKYTPHVINKVRKR